MSYYRFMTTQIIPFVKKNRYIHKEKALDNFTKS